MKNEKVIRKFLDETEEMMISLSKAMICAGCSKIISVESRYSCDICGMMLCLDCRKCKTHKESL